VDASPWGTFSNAALQVRIYILFIYVGGEREQDVYKVSEREREQETETERERDFRFGYSQS